MAPEQILAAYAGARVTELVNRDDILGEIKDAVQDESGRTSVFYITADGGTGKTFLAREVLHRCREGGEWATENLLAAEHEVDLYHHQTRSQEGFLSEFVAALPPEPACYETYKEKRRQLQAVEYDLPGARNEVRKLKDELVDAFLKGCGELTGDKRLVVVLDTVEKLVYETDRVQKNLGLGEAELGMRPWLLKEWLPKMQNTVILICGRPRKRFAENLQEVMGNHTGIEYVPATLGDFDESDTLQYFQAVARAAEQDGNETALRRLRAISIERRQVIYHLTGGHPITLALLIDYYLAIGRLLPEVKMSLIETQAMTSKELEIARAKVEAGIVTQFQELDRPADEVIRALAWTPKGMDARLLHQIAGIEEEEADRIVKVLAHRTQGLSFIKVRPTDDRIFLHDEMYELMKKHVLDALSEAEAERVYGEILDYYKDETAKQEDRVKELRAERHEELPPTKLRKVFLPTSLGAPADPVAFVDALARLDDLEVEELYYRLRRNPVSGFEFYYEVADAAVSSNDESQDMQLRDEMLTFVREAFGSTKEFRGLRRGDVERDAATRWVWRFLYAGQPEQAHVTSQVLRKKMSEFLARGGSLTTAELDVADGWTAAFLGRDLAEAENQLRATIDRLLQLRFEPMDKFGPWRRNLLLAKAYNGLGYVLRVQGRFHSACVPYRRALPFWRQLEMEANLAETLNNLAWANAEAGSFGRALRRCRAGLELREKEGYRYLIALSHNTLGLIEIKNDQPHRGRVHCDQALEIFQRLGVSRGVGLACTALAEAYRRQAETPDVYFPEQKVAQLRLAEEFALQAEAIFREEVQEDLRRVEALNELGCIYRDWARVWEEHHEEDDPTFEELVKNGTDALRDAAKLAKGTFPYRQVDALVNLAWLEYYVGQREKALEILNQAGAPVPQEYYFARKEGATATEVPTAFLTVRLEGTQFLRGHVNLTRQEGRPPVGDPITFLWVQLGKAHLLRGKIALDRYESSETPPGREEAREMLLEQVAKEFTLALAYYELFGDDFRDLRSAKNVMEQGLRNLNIKEIEKLHNNVESVAAAYQLEYRERTSEWPARPRMRNFMEEYFGLVEDLGKGDAWAEE